jgi:hypothetical protein
MKYGFADSRFDRRAANAIVGVLSLTPYPRVSDVACTLGVPHGTIAHTFAVLHRVGCIEKTAAGWEATGKSIPKRPEAYRPRQASKTAGRQRPVRETVVDVRRILRAPLSDRTERAIHEWKAARA